MCSLSLLILVIMVQPRQISAQYICNSCGQLCNFCPKGVSRKCIGYTIFLKKKKIKYKPAIVCGILEANDLAAKKDLLCQMSDLVGQRLNCILYEILLFLYDHKLFFYFIYSFLKNKVHMKNVVFIGFYTMFLLMYNEMLFYFTLM